MISFLDNIVSVTDEELAECDAFLREVGRALGAPHLGQRNDRLAPMMHHRDTHDASITPRAVSTAKPAPAGIGAVAGFGHRLGLPR